MDYQIIIGSGILATAIVIGLKNIAKAIDNLSVDVDTKKDKSKNNWYSDEP